MRLAGKTVLDHVLDIFKTIPEPERAEFIFIVGYLGTKLKSICSALILTSGFDTWSRLKCEGSPMQYPWREIT
jgi:hypothetical protein